MSYYSSDDPRSYSSGRIRPAAVLFWILIILAPFISAALLQLLTGTSALRLDAWNTTWNDEVGYFRVIRLLRHEFYPRGMYGFNEDAPANLAYGPYNIFTYLPYFVLSFFTGVENHNFIYYSNAALAVLAGLFYVLLVRPRAREGFFTVLFLVTYLVAGRYCGGTLYLVRHVGEQLQLLPDPVHGSGPVDDQAPVRPCLIAESGSVCDDPDHLLLEYDAPVLFPAARDSRIYDIPAKKCPLRRCQSAFLPSLRPFCRRLAGAVLLLYELQCRALFLRQHTDGDSETAAQQRFPSQNG